MYLHTGIKHWLLDFLREHQRRSFPGQELQFSSTNIYTSSSHPTFRQPFESDITFFEARLPAIRGPPLYDGRARGGGGET